MVEYPGIRRSVLCRMPDNRSKPRKTAAKNVATAARRHGFASVALQNRIFFAMFES
jgi:hypothetical protein